MLHDSEDLTIHIYCMMDMCEFTLVVIVTAVAMAAAGARGWSWAHKHPASSCVTWVLPPKPHITMVTDDKTDLQHTTWPLSGMQVIPVCQLHIYYANMLP